MSERWEPDDRRRELERIVVEQGWEDLEGLEDWDGEDLDELRELLSDDQFETLLDELSQIEVGDPAGSDSGDY